MPSTQQPASEKPWIRSIRTTAGDWERESRSRRFNAFEALGVMLFLLTMLWPLGYWFGVLGESHAVNTGVNLMLTLGAIYLLFVSPFIHKDTAHSWGLGNPVELWRILRESGTAKRAVLLTIMAVLFLALNYANFTRWRDVVRFFNLNDLAGFFGAQKPQIETFNQSFPGVLLVFGFGTVLSSLIVTCAIRYDNFISAFKTALAVSVPLLALTFIAAYMHRGAAAFSRLNFGLWALGVLGYVFWGFVQQLLFSSYFGTRFRKAFAPSNSQNNVVPRDQRFTVTALFGLGFGVLGATLAVLAIVSLYGAESINAPLIVWLFLFLLPLGAAYGYFFCLDKKRLLVATLTASCFGLIHIDSYGLVAVTWGLGIALVYVFMEEKNRNLVALGFIHGLLGSTFGSLFSKGESGALEIDYSVGPWNIEDPTSAALFIPLFCMAIYVVILIWCARTIHETEEA